MWVVWLATDNITTGRIPLFYERDDDFLAYVKDLMKDTATSRDELADELDKVWYMFSHIILSNFNLDTEFAYSALREIECQNGFRLLLRQPGEDLILIVGISADVSGSSLSEVHRRVDMLLTILLFLYGPSYDFHLSRKAPLEQRKVNWDTISLFLNKWHQMFNNEQSYLVEAIEEITTDTAYGSRGRPGEAMEDKVEAILNEARRIVRMKLGCTYDYVIHTMLVVEGKVVQFHSSEKDRAMSPYDMLLMLLSSLAYFPSNMVPEDLFSRPQRKHDGVASSISEDSDEDSRLDVPIDSDRAGTDRYFVDVMLDEELTTEQSDSLSMVSALSSDDYVVISSGNRERTTKSVDFMLGDSKLPPQNIKKVISNGGLPSLKLPWMSDESDSKLQNGTTHNIGKAFMSIAQSQNDFFRALGQIPNSKSVSNSVLKTDQSVLDAADGVSICDKPKSGREKGVLASKSAILDGANIHTDSGFETSNDHPLACNKHTDSLSATDDVDRKTLKHRPEENEIFKTCELSADDDVFPDIVECVLSASQALGEKSVEGTLVQSDKLSKDNIVLDSQTALDTATSAVKDSNFSSPVLVSTSKTNMTSDSRQDVQVPSNGESEDPEDMTNFSALNPKDSKAIDNQPVCLKRKVENTDVAQANGSYVHEDGVSGERAAVLGLGEKGVEVLEDLADSKHIKVSALENEAATVKSGEDASEGSDFEVSHADLKTRTADTSVDVPAAALELDAKGDDASCSGEVSTNETNLIEGKSIDNVFKVGELLEETLADVAEVKDAADGDSNGNTIPISSSLAVDEAEPVLSNTDSACTSVNSKLSFSVSSPDDEQSQTQISILAKIGNRGEVNNRSQHADLYPVVKYTQSHFTGGIPAAHRTGSSHDLRTSAHSSTPLSPNTAFVPPHHALMMSKSLPRMTARSLGRGRKDNRRVVSMTNSRPAHQEITRRRHSSLHDKGSDSPDHLTDDYFSAPNPQYSSSAPMPRRPSGDSEASYHTATTLLRSGPEYPLDTERLLTRVLAKEDPHHMIKGVFIHKRVFLRSTLCDYVPACLYVISVSPGINVIVAAEITDPHKPNKFVELLNQLSWLLHPKCFENKTLTPERMIDKLGEKLREVIELITVRIHDNTYKKTLDNTLVQWQKTASLLRKCYRDEERTIPYEIRRNVLKISEELKRSFRALYMTVTNLSNDAGDHMHRLQLYANKKLRFYKPILLVKANRNMAMSAFQNDKYPGLVHFLYINRNSNTMKSPSMQLPKEDYGVEALVVRDMKVRLWRILPWLYKQLSNGYTSISVKDGDFVFTFDLFMYNEVHYRFIPRMVAHPSLYNPPKISIGDMKGHFYKRLIKITDSVAGLKCLELLTVHFAVVPRDVIAKQRTLLLENELHKKHDPLTTY